jgi:hypothetical protein
MGRHEDPTPPRGYEQSGRRVDDVFGDVLPSTTSDERDPASSADRNTEADSWYLENRPPHHDR